MKMKDLIGNPKAEHHFVTSIGGPAERALGHGGRTMWAVFDVQEGLAENVSIFENYPAALEHANNIIRDYSEGRSGREWDKTEFESPGGIEGQDRNISWHSKDGQVDVYHWSSPVFA